MVQDLHELMKGGLVMWPLFLCGFVAVAVMVDRFLAIGIAVRSNKTFLANVAALLKAGKHAEALALCEQSPNRIAKLMAGGIRHKDLDVRSVERVMEEIALRELPLLYERLSVLDTIVTLAPLLGLLGTITGMIRAFHIVAATSGPGGLGSNPAAITGGVAEALIATAAGLSIAIFTLPAYNFLTERVKENVSEMELRAAQVLNSLPRRPAPEETPHEAAAHGA